LSPLDGTDHLTGIDAEHERADEHDEQPAAAKRTAAAARKATSATLADADVVRIEWVESHAPLQPQSANTPFHAGAKSPRTVAKSAAVAFVPNRPVLNVTAAQQTPAN
jgi:hypothetical protein